MGAVIGFSSVCAGASAVVSGYPLAWAFAAAVGAGSPSGLVNGLLVSMAASPRSSSRFARWALRRTGARHHRRRERRWHRFGAAAPLCRHVGGCSLPIVIVIAAYAVFHLLIYHTRYGAYVFAIGGNRDR